MLFDVSATRAPHLLFTSIFSSLLLCWPAFAQHTLQFNFNASQLSEIENVFIFIFSVRFTLHAFCCCLVVSHQIVKRKIIYDLISSHEKHPKKEVFTL